MYVFIISLINRTKVMSRESPFLDLSSVLNKISQKTLPFNSRPSQTSKNIGVLRALSTFSY